MIMCDRLAAPRRTALGSPKCTAAAFVLFGLMANLVAAGQQNGVAGAPGSFVKNYKLDADVSERSARGNPLAVSQVIVTLVPGAELPPQFNQYARGGKLDIINAQVLQLPNKLLQDLGANANVFRVHDDRAVFADNYRTAVTVGARAVQQSLGYSGAGIGVAVIDSGITTWHDDLTTTSTNSYPYGNQRVTKFVDFVNGHALPYDDNGHGSHVAGTILGNGYDSLGEKAGIAPGASLVSLKVLDANGQGTISSTIRALNWVAANYRTYNVRVVNLSVGAGIHESYWTDPLTIAAKAVADKGITVVAAAGNLGQTATGKLQFGGITAPGNAPWVLTVGASSTLGTLTRADDEMAPYSSAGPTFIDFSAKPDLVAPGTGTVSLAVAGSVLYAAQASYLVDGSVQLGFKSYLSLSGTSMAAPVVAGTVALMLEANPRLTPNLVKAILQYTSETYPGYSPLRQGAGFLNSLGAVRLAKFYSNNRVGETVPVQRIWSRRVIWGNHRLVGGYLNPRGNAWATTTLWGSAKTAMSGGDNIVWGTRCTDGSCDNIVWGTRDANGDNIVWGTRDANGDNIVWGTVDRGDNIVWGTAGGDNIVWGTWGGGDNIVWGTDCGGADCTGVVWGSAGERGDNIVWGTGDRGDNIVWGTGDRGDNIVWGTAERGDNIVWGTAGHFNVMWATGERGDNIVWGTWGGDNIVWGTWGGDNIVWGTSAVPGVMYPDIPQPLPSLQIEFGDIVPLPQGGR
jgi:serine protease AprX